MKFTPRLSREIGVAASGGSGLHDGSREQLREHAAQRQQRSAKPGHTWA